MSTKAEKDQVTDDEIYAQRTKDYYKPYLRRFKRLHSPLLELGAGHGLFLELCRDNSVEAVGIEVDPARVRRMRENGLVVLQQDLGEPLAQFPDSHFSLIFCNQVIEHLERPTQWTMLREAFRVMRPGGEFQVCSPCRHWEAARLQPGHISLLTPSELAAMLREVGFNSINLDWNRPQPIPELPEEIIRELWKKYKPDLLSISATAICSK